MASKLKLLTFLQQVRGLAEVNRRCPCAQPLRRLELASPSSKAILRRKVAISTDARNVQDVPNPVPIVLVKQSAPPADHSPL